LCAALVGLNFMRAVWFLLLVFSFHTHPVFSSSLAKHTQ